MQFSFPKLTIDNHKETSPDDWRYNCIAWAAGDNTRWWWPDEDGVYYWPEGVSRSSCLSAFIDAFALQGYSETSDFSFEKDKEKIAIYADENGAPTHAARLIGDCVWTSKLGRLVDISHEIDALDGPAYGKMVFFMERERRD